MPSLAVSLASVALQIAVAVTTAVVYRLSPFHPLAKFPGPKLYKISSLSLAHTVLSGWRHKVIQDLHTRYGPFVRIGPNTLSVNSRAAISTVYTSSQCLDKSLGYNLPMLPGDGLFFMQGRDPHNVRRNRWARAFTTANLEHFQGALDSRTVELTECMLSRAKEGIVDLSVCIEHWSYDFMGDFVFGASSDLELMRNGDPLNLVQGGKVATIVFDVLGEVPWLMDILWYLPYTQSVRALHGLARRLVTKRLKFGEDDGKDVAAYLLATDVRGEPDLTEDEQTMDALFAIQAGSDTTANVLQYSFFHLLAHKDTYRKLTKELDEAFPFPTEPLDFNVLASLPYLNAVINEALRLGTPLSGLPRVTPPSGTVISGVFVPGDTVVSVPAFTQQLDSQNFSPRTEDFVPERWLPGGIDEKSRLEPTGLMSFSSGPFGCLGRSLAMQELRIVIARLVLKFDMSFPGDFDHRAYHRKIRNIRTTLFPSPVVIEISVRGGKGLD